MALAAAKSCCIFSVLQKMSGRWEPLARRGSSAPLGRELAALLCALLLLLRRTRAAVAATAAAAAAVCGAKQAAGGGVGGLGDAVLVVLFQPLAWGVGRGGAVSCRGRAVCGRGRGTISQEQLQAVRLTRRAVAVRACWPAAGAWDGAHPPAALQRGRTFGAAPRAPSPRSAA